MLLCIVMPVIRVAFTILRFGEWGRPPSVSLKVCMAQNRERGRMPGRRGSLRAVSLELGKVAICLVLVELVLRLAGYDPNSRSAGVHPGVVGDPVLGWRYAPGRYLFSDSTIVPTRTVASTHLYNGARDSGGSGQGVPLALFGCSFVDGYGLDDKETIAWKLQERLPHYAVKNFGVSGYGTYSVLLKMNEVEPALRGHAGAISLYGFADFHPPRNVRNPVLQQRWAKHENAQNAKGVYPVCDDGGCSVWVGGDMNQWWRRSRLLSLVRIAWDVVLSLQQVGLAERVTGRLYGR